MTVTNNGLTFAELQPFLKADLSQNLTPALLGETGIGKSSLIEDLGRAFKTEVFTLPVNQLADVADLTGVRAVQSENGQWRQESFPHSIIMDAIEHAEAHPEQNPILFMDEFNRAGADITSAILSFHTLRRVGTLDFPDNLRFVIAGNDKGNVVSLDQASISRFSVYNVVPDIETFLEVQTDLNPFIRAVLSKHPDDLMAEKAAGTEQNADGSDDDDNDNDADIFNELEMLDEENFAQITRPRTITYASQWLDALGIDKSESQDEQDMLSRLVMDASNTSDNILMEGIKAHVGDTTFAVHLFEEIQAHFNHMLSSTHQSNQPLLKDLRPHQRLINRLNQASDVQDIEDMINHMDEDAVLNTIVWLTELESTKEIDNNRSVETFIANGLHKVSDFDGKSAQNLMKVLPEPNRVSTLATNAMINSNANVMNKWRSMIQSVIEDD